MNDQTRTLIRGQLDGAALMYNSYHERYAAEEEIYELDREVKDILRYIRYAETNGKKRKEIREVADIRVKLALKHRALAEKHAALAKRDEQLAGNCYRAAEISFGEGKE